MWHLGIHLRDINPLFLNPPMDQNYKMTIWFNVCNACILPFVKASILLLLLKVGGVIDNVRKFIYCVFVLNAVACAITAMFLLFECPVLAGRKWQDRTFGNLRCAGLVIIGRICTFQVSINMFTDLLVFPIPCYLTWRLQKTSFRNRLIVVFLFSLSLGVTGISAAKIYYTYQGRLFVAAPDDWTWKITFTMNHWENCVAIVVACVPSLRILILSWLGKDDSTHPGSGGNPIRIGGVNGISQTQGSVRENFLARLRPPPKKRGLYDTTLGEQTIDLERGVVKTPYNEAITEEDPDMGSCSSQTAMNHYARDERVSTVSEDKSVDKPGTSENPV
ncbi:hypothetical protein TWF696_001580 [Orbilia brochopaga]|uniref:Rhodopsin domain-containing protein n=1 Tax=Orbilia brochopaga TaxID=3140254 RepID=A0AAV9U9Y5_9PEZI